MRWFENGGLADGLGPGPTAGVGIRLGVISPGSRDGEWSTTGASGGFGVVDLCTCTGGGATVVSSLTSCMGWGGAFGGSSVMGAGLCSRSALREVSDWVG